MAAIQTGVDKLLTLLHDKKKVSVEEAAKTLGVSKIVIQEWGDFLEEEGMLEIKYSLSKTYLMEKVLSKQEFQQKEKQFEGQRETFIKKIDATLAQLDIETSNFEKFKLDFQEIKKQLGSDLDVLQKDSQQLKEYETLKKDVLADIQQQHNLFQEKQIIAENALQHQYKQYHDILHQISQQEKRLSLEKQRVHTIIQSEATVEKKIDAYTQLLTQLKNRVSAETKQLGFDETMLEKLHTNALGFKQSLETINRENLQPLFLMKANNEAQVKQLEQQILEKAAKLEKAIKNPVAKRPAVRKQLEAFFKRKKVLDSMFETIDKDKQGLILELKELQQRATAYQLGKTNVRLEELESKLSTIEERKKGLAGHIMKFIKLLH